MKNLFFGGTPPFDPAAASRYDLPARPHTKNAVSRPRWKPQLNVNTWIRIAAGLLVAACMSYPELVAGEERDASMSPERPAAPMDAAGEGTDARAEGGAGDGSATQPRSCEDCGAHERCCETKKSKGQGRGDRLIECRPREASCDEDG